MESKEFFHKLMSRYLWSNIAAMIGVVIVVCAGVKFGIDIYTHHGEAISVPNIKHKKFADAEHILNELGLQIVVTDTGYVKSLPPGTVLEQSPVAGMKVKSGRTIYFTINSSHTPTLALPDIIDNCSYREALAKLNSMGFNLGAPEYVAGENDWVYGVKCRGRNISAGERVPIDQAIIVQVGSGMVDESDSIYIVEPVHDMPEVGDIIEGEGGKDLFEEVIE